MGACYRKKKEEFDDMIYGYIVRKLKDPINQSDAYLSHTVDEYGNVNDGYGASWAYTKLDKLIFDIKMELGDKVKNIVDDYSHVDLLSLMCGKVDPQKYSDSYAGVLALIGEAGYLPEIFRGKGNYIDESEDEQISKPERISFALTIATYLLYCVKYDRMPTEREFNDNILTATEATFDVRSIGSYQEITNEARNCGLVDGRELTKSGYVLVVRLAKWIVGHDLCKTTVNTVDNETRNWRQLSHAG